MCLLAAQVHTDIVSPHCNNNNNISWLFSTVAPKLHSCETFLFRQLELGVPPLKLSNGSFSQFATLLLLLLLLLFLLSLLLLLLLHLLRQADCIFSGSNIVSSLNHGHTNK
jgi:hypothetical protein